MATKRTYQASKKKRATSYGFRKKMSSKNGRKVIKRRMLKGRIRVTPR